MFNPVSRSAHNSGNRNPTRQPAVYIRLAYAGLHKWYNYGMTDNHDKNDNGIPDYVEEAFSKLLIFMYVKAILWFLGILGFGWILYHYGILNR